MTECRFKARPQDVDFPLILRQNPEADAIMVEVDGLTIYLVRESLAERIDRLQLFNRTGLDWRYGQIVLEDHQHGLEAMCGNSGRMLLGARWICGRPPTSDVIRQLIQESRILEVEFTVRPL